MKNPFSAYKEPTLFVLFGVAMLILTWILFILAIFNFFVLPVILFSSLLLLGTALFFLIRFLQITPNLVRYTVIALFALSILNCLTVTPTLLSGRDQGAISEAAIRLSQNTVLTSESPAIGTFFDIYGPGLALNFPGFAYTESGSLITQFPLAYTSFLAGSYTLLGTNGLQIANMLLLFCFLFTLYELIRLFVRPSYASIGMLLGAFTFLPLWFSRYTLTENLAVFLFTFLAYCLTVFLRDGKYITYFGILLSGGLLAFTRIEGYVFLFITFLILFSQKSARQFFALYPIKSLVFPGVIFLFLFLRNFFVNLPYYKTIGRALEKFLNGFGSDVINSSGGGILAGQIPVGGVLILYGALPLFLVGILSYVVIWRHKKYTAFIPLILALPTLLYLFLPNITLDHPWMLRRYYFSLFPTFVFGTVVGFSLLVQKTKKPLATFSSLIFILFLFSVPAQMHFLLERKNDDLVRQIETFASGFTSNTLILMDRKTTGSGFAMPTAPLSIFFDRQAVYFFNPEDIAKIDFSRYDRVVLVVPETELSRYAEAFGDRLIYKGSYLFQRNGLEERSLTNNQELRFPENKFFETKNLIFQVY